jgi:hypothetical protein
VLNRIVGRLIFLVIVSGSTSGAPGSDSARPVGGRVRVKAERLRSGWHEGVFSRTRSEPPCYVVVIFKPRSSAGAAIRHSATVPIRDVSRLQLFTGPEQALGAWAGLPGATDGDALWRDVATSVLAEAKRACTGGQSSSRQPGSSSAPECGRRGPTRG